MKRLLVAARANAEAFATCFRAELPEHEIVTALPSDGGAVAYAVVGRPEPGLLASIPGLELVLSLNAGVEHLLASGEVPPGVPIVRMVDPGLVEGMVEWVSAHVLAWHRNLFAYRDKQVERRWAPAAEKLARERTVTVLGAGALGGPVATMLASFGFRTRAWSRSPRTLPGIECFAGEGGLAEAAAGADILVNLLPSTAQTLNVVDAALLAQLAPGALLVNGGRGATMVDADVLTALDSGQLSAAALDVFRTEPLPADDPYWAREDVLVSPHVAAPTHVSTSVAVMAESVRAWERGETPANVVDPALGY
ncbi:2-hydroxyacid dehydrogenase [Sphingomonas jatrophae]|uniref:Glyoxylate/hydroxypyruvate reductase A n=1 Tax=Sphingomonas jatrophae TaxID=1166337 RepID=A0A1I6KBL4_9SPHN|nr:glyoxylate/hydroxypyruvate reductase A [Sphingomonas jatrophae]SFR88260.1 glyoxylate/hydroxypyruvate reductase A [Sphingomonas jatrophae]